MKEIYSDVADFLYGGWEGDCKTSWRRCWRKDDPCLLNHMCSLSAPRTGSLNLPPALPPALALLLKQRQYTWNVSQCSCFKRKCMKGVSSLHLLGIQLEPKLLGHFAREVSVVCSLMILSIKIFHIDIVSIMLRSYFIHLWIWAIS